MQCLPVSSICSFCQIIQGFADVRSQPQSVFCHFTGSHTSMAQSASLIKNGPNTVVGVSWLITTTPPYETDTTMANNDQHAHALSDSSRAFLSHASNFNYFSFLESIEEADTGIALEDYAPMIPYTAMDLLALCKEPTIVGNQALHAFEYYLYQHSGSACRHPEDAFIYHHRLCTAVRTGDGKIHDRKWTYVITTATIPNTFTRSTIRDNRWLLNPPHIVPKQPPAPKRPIIMGDPREIDNPHADKPIKWLPTPSPEHVESCCRIIREKREKRSRDHYTKAFKRACNAAAAAQLSRTRKACRQVFEPQAGTFGKVVAGAGVLAGFAVARAATKLATTINRAVSSIKEAKVTEKLASGLDAVKSIVPKFSGLLRDVAVVGLLAVALKKRSATCAVIAAAVALLYPNGGVCARIVQHLVKRDEASVSPQGPLKTKSVAIAMVSALMFLTVLKRKTPRNSALMATFLGTIGNFDKITQGWDSFLKFAGRILERLIHFTGKCFGKDWNVDLVGDDYPEITQFATAVTDLAVSVRLGKTAVNCATVKRVRHFITTDSRLRERYRQNREGINLINGVSKELNYLLDRFGPLVSGKTGQRPQPPVVMIYGSPGIGKSLLTPDVLDSVCDRILPQEVKEALDFDYSGEIYLYPTEENYANGYCGQTATVFEDIGLGKSAIGDKKNDFLRLASLANPYSKPLDQAAIAGKGNSFFQSDIIYCTTNVDNIDSYMAPHIHCVDALIRRISAPYHCELREEWAVGEPGRKQLNVRKYNDFRLENPTVQPDAWTFTRWDFRLAKADSQRPEPLTLDQLKEELVRQVEDNRAFFDNSSRMRAEINRARGEASRAVPTENVSPQAGSEPDEEIVPDEGWKDSVEATFRRHAFSGVAPELPSDWDLSYLLGQHPEESDQVRQQRWRILRALAPEIQAQLLREDPIMDKKYQKQKVRWLAKEGFGPVANRDSCPDPDVRARSAFIYNECSERLNAASSPPKEQKQEQPAFGARLHQLGEKRHWLDNPRLDGEKGVDGVHSVDFMALVKFLIAYGLVVAFVSLIISTTINVFNGIVGIFTSMCGTVRDKIVPGRKKQKRFRVQSEEEKKCRLKPHLDHCVVPQSQFQLDKPASTAESIMLTVQSNMYSIWLGKTRLGFGTFVRDRVMAMPFHFLQCVRESSQENVHFVNLTTGRSFDLLRTTFIHPDNKIGEASRLDEPNKDRLWLRMPHVRAHRDIVNFFCRQNVTDARPKAVCLTVRNFGGAYDGPAEARNETIHNCKHLDDFHLDDTEQVVTRGYIYPRSFKTGDCGAAVYLSNDKKVEQCPLVGIHIGGRKGEGVCNLISREAVEDACRFFDAPESVLEDTPYAGVITPQSGCSPFPDMPVIYTANTPYNVNMRTTLQESEVWGAWGDFGKSSPNFMPFVKSDGTIVVPTEKALAPYASPVFEQDPLEIREAMYSALQPLAELTLDHPRDIVSFREAVVGIPGRFKGIPRGTAIGGQYALLGQKNKKKTFGSEEWLLDTPEALEVEKNVKQLIDNARKGIRQPHLYIEFNKDEALATNKVIEDGKIRLISACPLDLMIATREYFINFTAAVLDTRIDNHIAAGINPMAEWDKLSRRLRSRGFGCVAGDYSRFDASEQPQLLEEIVHYINDWYNDGPDNARVRRVLWLEVLNSLHLSGFGSSRSHVVMWAKSLPSGHPLTTIINSIYNLTLFSMAWNRLAPPGLRNKLHDYTYLVVLGDDNIQNISAHVHDWWNQHTITEAMTGLHMKYTDESKSSGVLLPVRPLTQCTFCKRSFLKTLDGYVGPLDLSSALFAPYVYRKSAVSPRQILEDTIEGALGELSLHPAAVWDRYKPLIVSKCAEIGLVPKLCPSQCIYRNWYTAFIPPYL